jgi:hypothetical protein
MIRVLGGILFMLAAIFIFTMAEPTAELLQGAMQSVQIYAVGRLRLRRVRRPTDP